MRPSIAWAENTAKHLIQPVNCLGARVSAGTIGSIDAEPRSCACTPSGQARDFSQILSHPLACAPSGQHCHLLSSSTGLRTVRPASLVIHAFLSCVALTQKIAVFERHPKLARQQATRSVQYRMTIFQPTVGETYLRHPMLARQQATRSEQYRVTISQHTVGKTYLTPRRKVMRQITMLPHHRHRSFVRSFVLVLLSLLPPFRQGCEGK